MWIYLLRHGIAEDAAPGTDDADRRLTDEGRQRLQRASRSWQRLLEPLDVVFTSPLIRARETADILLDAVRCTSEPRVDEAFAPHGAPSAAVALLEAELFSATNSVAIVGHEPHLGYLLGTLLTAHPRLSIPFKKGMLVALEVVSTASLTCSLRFALTHKAAARLA